MVLRHCTAVSFQLPSELNAGFSNDFLLVENPIAKGHFYIEIFTTVLTIYGYSGLLSNNLKKVSLDLTNDASDSLSAVLEIVNALFPFFLNSSFV
jgi:hypothetical protein